MFTRIDIYSYLKGSRFKVGFLSKIPWQKKRDICIIGQLKVSRMCHWLNLTVISPTYPLHVTKKQHPLKIPPRVMHVSLTTLTCNPATCMPASSWDTSQARCGAADSCQSGLGGSGARREH